MYRCFPAIAHRVGQVSLALHITSLVCADAMHIARGSGAEVHADHVLYATSRCSHATGNLLVLQYTSRAAQLYRQQLEKEAAKFRCVLAGNFDSLAIPLQNCVPAQCMLLQPQLMPSCQKVML